MGVFSELGHRWTCSIGRHQLLRTWPWILVGPSRGSLGSVTPHRSLPWVCLLLPPLFSTVLGISSSRNVKAGETENHQRPIDQLSYCLTEADEIYGRDVHSTHQLHTLHTTHIIHMYIHTHIYIHANTCNIHTKYVPSMHPSPYVCTQHNTIHTL